MFKKTKTLFKILFHITFVLAVLLTAASPLLLGNASIINSKLGIETQVGYGSDDGGEDAIYYNTAYKSVAEVRQGSLAVIEEAMSEGAVLLKNDNGALPLDEEATTNKPGTNEKPLVTLYGAASYWSVHTGQGSGGAVTGALNDRVTLYQGLTDAGLNVNADMNDFYRQNGSAYMDEAGSGDTDEFIGDSNQTSEYVVRDMAWSQLPDYKDTTDVAIMVLARNSGEALDLYQHVEMAGGNESLTNILGRAGKGNYTTDKGDALELSANEADVLTELGKLKTENKIQKIIVLMNTANPMQCEFLENSDYGIDACMWIGNMGTNGAAAVGKLLTGEYNPSGGTVNTFWEESRYNPVYFNFGSIRYGNYGILENYFATESFQNANYYVVYQEGIYNGYKYTETRYEDYVMQTGNAGDFDYDEVVTYPFGHGLSYSTFEYSDFNVEYDAETDTYTVSVRVTNTSAVPGKEIVQVYLQKPYTAKDKANGVEKAAVELVGFGKTGMLGASGSETASEVVEVEVKGKYFAAYDANVEKTYVVGSDDTNDRYRLTVARNAHDAVNNILAAKGYTPQNTAIAVPEGQPAESRMDAAGNADLVYEKYFAYDNTTYSTNEWIESQNENFVEEYPGQEANYGVDKITNQFDDVDFKKAGIFSSSETGDSQPYLTRSDWTGTYGYRIDLTATDELVVAQRNPAVQTDNIQYPTYGEMNFFETADTFDQLKLIHLRGKDYNDPQWSDLLDQMTWEETCDLLQDALRYTNAVPSIAAPSTSQQNGGCAPNHHRDYSDLPSQSAFRGFAEYYEDVTNQNPAVFLNNGLVASTYNPDLMYRYGRQTGEEGIWQGYNGIYGLGINIHRGAYGGRAFEYYSEDGFMTGAAAGYEAVGLHKVGVFVIAKHASLNDQETHRAGLNVWANEQSVREIYNRAIEVMVEIDREYTPNTLVGMMTGMNRIGAKWNGGQGSYNTVLRAEYGMMGYTISDYNSSRYYMSPIQGVLNGCDLPDGNPAGNSSVDYNGNSLWFSSYASGYGKFAWAMREAAKHVLYTIVNSNAMNGITSDSSFEIITPVWETVVSIAPSVMAVLCGWCGVGFLLFWGINTATSYRVEPPEAGKNK